MATRTHLAPAPADGTAGTPAHARVRVVLAEDHATMRRSLRLLLDSEPDIEVVAESGELATATRQVFKLAPDVLVLDVRMPDGSSFDIVEHLRAQVPRTRIVVITMYDDQAFARHAHGAGALGFVLKDTADAELPEAVRCAAHGRTYTSPRITPHVVPLRKL